MVLLCTAAPIRNSPSPILIHLMGTRMPSRINATSSVRRTPPTPRAMPPREPVATRAAPSIPREIRDVMRRGAAVAPSSCTTTNGSAAPIKPAAKLGEKKVPTLRWPASGALMASRRMLPAAMLAPSWMTSTMRWRCSGMSHSPAATRQAAMWVRMSRVPGSIVKRKTWDVSPFEWMSRDATAEPP